MVGRGIRRWALVAVTGIGLAVFATAVVAPAISRARAESQDQETVAEINGIYQSDLRLEEIAKQVEIRISEIQGATHRHEQNIRLARLYTDIGESLFHRNDMDQAEQAYRKANQLDGADARAMADLGELYATLANRGSLNDRLAAYDESARWWNQAADASSADAGVVRAYEQRVAEIYLAESRTLVDASRYTEAGNTIHEGLALVPEGSNLAHKLGQLQTQVAGSASSSGSGIHGVYPLITTAPPKDSPAR
ncbi:MAG TPA: hypothetical protein VHE55_08530 [Fimbriimonadaceae bacterium]|nr:hypothetical protein [Fimbriimonadaceae bacterium]